MNVTNNIFPGIRKTFLEDKFPQQEPIERLPSTEQVITKKITFREREEKELEIFKNLFVSQMEKLEWNCFSPNMPLKYAVLLEILKIYSIEEKYFEKKEGFFNNLMIIFTDPECTLNAKSMGERFEKIKVFLTEARVDIKKYSQQLTLVGNIIKSKFFREGNYKLSDFIDSFETKTKASEFNSKHLSYLSKFFDPFRRWAKDIVLKGLNLPSFKSGNETLKVEGGFFNKPVFLDGKNREFYNELTRSIKIFEKILCSKQSRYSNLEFYFFAIQKQVEEGSSSERVFELGKEFEHTVIFYTRLVKKIHEKIHEGLKEISNIMEESPPPKKTFSR